MSRSNSVTCSEVFELSYSVWDFVCKACPEEEAHEVKKILGESLVEEANDLLSEANLLLDIWHQMREASDPGGPHEGDLPQALQEPPGIRERLLREINFLIKHIKQKDANLLECSTVSPSMLEYACTIGDSEVTSRPGSAISKDIPEALIRWTPTSDSSCSPSDFTVPQSITLGDISGTVCSLREALRAECEQRKRDIDFLQECIDKEIDYSVSTGTHTAIPSIKELQAVSQKLEQEILKDSSITSGPKNQFSETVKKPTKTPPLIINRSTVQVNRASRVKQPSATYTSLQSMPRSASQTNHPPVIKQSSCNHYFAS